MMKKPIALLLAVCLLLGLTACGATGEGASASQSDWVTYKEIYDRVRNDDGQDILVYSYQQPVVNAKAAGANIINTKLDNATTAFLYGSGGVQEMTELAKMDWKESWFTCYSLTREVSVARMDDTVVSFRYSDYAFTGGVHGYTAEYGMTYDMGSGEQLSLESLSEEPWGLREVCRQYLMEYLANEELEYYNALFPDYINYLDTVLKNWVFTEDGLQFIAQPYVIAAYAAGTLRITVPYARIAHVLDEKWMPESHSRGDSSVTVSVVEEVPAGMTDFVISDTGMQFVVNVSGTVYDFAVEGVNAYPGAGTMVYYMTQQHLYSPEITSESVAMRLSVPDTRPDTMLCWRDSEGNSFQYYLTYDGQNGGVVMKAANPRLERE